LPLLRSSDTYCLAGLLIVDSRAVSPVRCRSWRSTYICTIKR